MVPSEFLIAAGGQKYQGLPLAVEDDAAQGLEAGMIGGAQLIEEDAEQAAFGKPVQELSCRFGDEFGVGALRISQAGIESCQVGEQG